MILTPSLTGIHSARSPLEGSPAIAHFVLSSNNLDAFNFALRKSDQQTMFILHIEFQKLISIIIKIVIMPIELSNRYAPDCGKNFNFLSSVWGF